MACKNCKCNINGHDPIERKKQVLRCIPDIYDYKTILYIGGHAKHNRHLQLCDKFLKHNYTIDVIEAFKPNVDEMKEHYKWINEIYHGDITRVKPEKNYDIIMFWHGIEHINKSEMSDFIKHLTPYANKLLVFACPYGVYTQGAEYDNPYEVHVSHWYPKELESLGLKTDHIGPKDKRNANNLLAWKRM